MIFYSHSQLFMVQNVSGGSFIRSRKGEKIDVVEIKMDAEDFFTMTLAVLYSRGLSKKSHMRLISLVKQVGIELEHAG